MAIILPRELIPATTGSPRILTLYGPPKVGKTTIVSVLPDALLLDLEDGSDFVTAMKLKLQNPLQIKPFVDEVIKAGRPYKYLIIDTIDKLEEWAEIEATREYKASIKGKTFTGNSVLELPQGGGYFYLRETFRKFFNLLYTAAPRIIYIGHVRDKVIDGTGTDVTSKDLDLTNKIRILVCKLSDAIGHIYRDSKGNLLCNFTTTDISNCGSRCAHLRGKVINFSSPVKLEDWKAIYSDL